MPGEDHAVAIVFLPLNGIGLGHLSRSFILSRMLLAQGEAPVVFAQGHYPEFMSREVPGFSIGAIYLAAKAERRRIAAEVQTYARRTKPAVVIEDTHPTPIKIDSDVRRILLIRPTTIEYLRELHARHARSYHAVLIADDFESPTWPFNPADTAEIKSWSNWSFLGPIFREGSAEGRVRIRRKYSLHESERAYVFSMGGGGVQSTGGRDTAEFCTQAEQFARILRRQCGECRLLFIRGPLFPASQPLPDLFEDYATEDDMPSLFGVAAGAVIRPGFNTTWECLAAGTPFLAITGHTFFEPIADRLDRLTEARLLPRTVEEWLDPAWSDNFRQFAAETVARWPISSAVEHLRSTIGADKDDGVRRLSLSSCKAPRDGREASGVLLVRVDDVTELSDGMVAIFEMCAARNICLSLEVVPYLCRLDERTLQTLLGGAIRFEVSQHGYSHLPQRTGEGRKSEFTAGQDFDADLRKGFARLRELFPTSFRGGFSAPYDSFPYGICQSWQRLGGQYISALWAALNDCNLPVVYYPVDPWNWKRDNEHSQRRSMRQLRASLQSTGCTGLALHPQLLNSPARIARLEKLLDAIMTLGCQPALASEVVAGRQLAHSTSRD